MRRWAEPTVSSYSDATRRGTFSPPLEQPGQKIHCHLSQTPQYLNRPTEVQFPPTPCWCRALMAIIVNLGFDRSGMNVIGIFGMAKILLPSQTQPFTLDEFADSAATPGSCRRSIRQRQYKNGSCSLLTHKSAHILQQPWINSSQWWDQILMSSNKPARKQVKWWSKR
ncbi:uncharacterized protein LOC111948738 isoform X2 [Oryzias latipes]